MVEQELRPLVIPRDTRGIYETLQTVYRRYLDMREEYRKVAAVWVMAVKYHDVFETFPYLYLNAMKGSGKTRFMKLTSFIVGGDMTTSITDSIIFRERTPIFIDEAESISNSEQASKRELLNVAYKKGGVVKRTERNDQGKFEVVSKDSFRAISLANIDGLDDVLEDRCIKIVLEKSFDKDITRRLEMFGLDNDVMRARSFLSMNEDSDVSVVFTQDMDGSNVTRTYTSLCYHYMNDTNNTTNNTQQTTQTTYELTDEAWLIVEKVEKTSLLGRDLELWMPLFVVAAHLGEDVLDSVITAAKAAAADRQQSNMMENPDVVLIGFLKDYMAGKGEREYVGINDIVTDFLQLNTGDEEWFNSKWLGRALIRNQLVAAKRRLGRGREVILDKNKILEKAKKFGLVEDLASFQVRSKCEVCGAGNRSTERLQNRFDPLKFQSMCGECAPEHAVLSSKPAASDRTAFNGDMSEPRSLSSDYDKGSPATSGGRPSAETGKEGTA